MASIQAVYIRGHEERTDPKPHIVYRIEVTASIRGWQAWRRYSEFDDLNDELTKAVGAAPPAPLPKKHPFSLFTKRSDPALVEERRVGLEQYLRAIVSSKDDRWREQHAFRDFLCVPVGKQPTIGLADGGASSAPSFNSASWLEEHLDLQSRLRDVRADINKRDALSAGQDVAGAHSANVQAKKKLAGALTRVSALERGLQDLAKSGTPPGELQRRTDMAARLRDECEQLARIATAARHTSAAARAGGSGAVPDTDRQALLQTGPGFGAKPAGRVFGAPKPVETEETRALDERGLLQLQQQKMEQQDQDLSSLTTGLTRLKQLGLAIHQEVSEQNEVLDDLNNEVDRVGGKLGNAKRQLNRLG